MSTAAPETTITAFGPAGRTVFERTYSRPKADGSKETWPETVERVARGNLELVYGNCDDKTWPAEVQAEYHRLRYYMNEFALLPAGRHLWATGVPGRQYIQNCWVAGWGEKISEHFEFAFLRLMEGGGVGANYSMKHIGKFGAPKRKVDLYLHASALHQDTEELGPHLESDSPATGMPVADSREGWASALTSLINYAYSEPSSRSSNVMQFNLSGIRPSGSELKTFGGTASGPAPFARMMHEVADVLNRAWVKGELTPLDVMEMDHAIAECVVSGGNRRSARMSIVHWADPYATDFIGCKQDTGKHWTTNVSVEVDDEFFRYLSMPVGGASEQKAYQAKAVHELVVKGMLENGEPGYWNSSLSSKGEVGQIIATNPCGEICLEASEPCTLGHVNMDWFAGKGKDELIEAHRLMTRFLIRATYGDVNDAGARAVMDRNRRIGVGHLGVQGYWAKQGVRYSDIPENAANELIQLYREVRKAAREYAFQLRIPEPVKVTAMAPTGSVAKLPGVTESAQAIHSRYFEQRIRFSKRDPAQFQTVLEAMNKGFTVEDDVYDKSGMTAVVVYPTENLLLSQVRALGYPDDVVQSQDELSVSDMLAVQHCYQAYWADNAVSYTVNIPEGKYSAHELGQILAGYLPMLKGTTVMVDASRPQSPYTRISREEFLAAVAVTVDDGISEECSSGACPIK